MVIAIFLIIIGVIGLLLSTMMFGDIGLAAFIGSITALLSGINFILLNRKDKKMTINKVLVYLYVRLILYL